MEFLINLMLLFFNLGLIVGLILGAIVLLRPLLRRLLRAQQRVILWTMAWIMAYMPSAYQVTNFIRVLPFTFRDLVVPRTGGVYDIPAYLPDLYQWAGEYNLALPGGRAIPVSLNIWSLLLVCMVWVGGIIFLIWRSDTENKALQAIARQGTRMPEDDPVFQAECSRVNDDVEVYLCAGLPTSFVSRGKITDNYKMAIFLQDHLSQERMHLVLRHEMEHIRLKHCLFKIYASFGIYLFWWNPLVWLGYRYFCQDMELACDEAVLKRLEEEERREYAKMLVELGSGRQLWESALSFGECDAALRVKAVVAWKPWSWWKRILSWGTALLVMLFFIGGPQNRTLGDDYELHYQRYAAAQSEEFAETLNKIVFLAGGEQWEQVEQVWVEVEDNSLTYWIGIETAEGGWYRAYLYRWGKGGMLLEETAKRLTEVPDLTDARPVLP